MELPAFKTRNALIERLTIKDKQASALVRVSETRWWGLSRRDLSVSINCRKITRKEPEWSSYMQWGTGWQIIPVSEDSEVLDVVNKAVKDMRHLGLTCFEQLLAYRLQIHMRKHDAKENKHVVPH